MVSAINTLSENQLAQAWAIAQYDVQAANRYCTVVAAKNQLKCPICGSDLVKGSGATYSLVCSRYGRRRHHV